MNEAAGRRNTSDDPHERLTRSAAIASRKRILEAAGGWQAIVERA